MPYTVPEKKERNDEIVRDYQKLIIEGGQSMVVLVIKYGISTQRIHQILKRRGIKLRPVARKKR